MKKAIVLAAALLCSAAAAQAQTQPRWKLDYDAEKPQIFTYRDGLDNLENYWFFTYTLANNTDRTIPLLVDLMLYTDLGKELQHDAAKVDPEPAKETRDRPRRAEALRFGRFYSNVLVPEHIEYKIIEHHAKLGARSPGLVREAIESFKKGFEEDPADPEFQGRWKKGDRLYLNPREMRLQRFIQPGQKLHGIAIFRKVDARSRVVEVHASGLWDVVRVDSYLPEEMTLHYENKVLKTRYEFRGDEFERGWDVLVQTKREWTVKPIGPIASKDTLTKIVDTLLAELNREEKWASGELKPEEVEAQRKANPLTPIDHLIAARVYRLATGQDFGYDPEKSLLENKAAVWRMHEWWVTHASRLSFNEATGRFELQDNTLPGQQKD